MYLIECIFIVIGFMGLFDSLADKFSWWNLIERTLIKVSEKTRIKPLFELAFCMFCQRFWIMVFLTAILSVFKGFSFLGILVPFLSIGLYMVFKTND